MKMILVKNCKCYCCGKMIESIEVEKGASILCYECLGVSKDNQYYKGGICAEYGVPIEPSATFKVCGKCMSRTLASKSDSGIGLL